VLTKNQVMMIYKLAAVSGRDLDDQIGIIQEIVPVVGAGFAWRSLARGVASMVPFAAGTLPKVAIAFAGTLVMGRAAEFYYRTKPAPDKGAVRGFRPSSAGVAGSATATDHTPRGRRQK
jgi:uncharacterized protein (DUF697 family)